MHGQHCVSLPEPAHRPMRYIIRRRCMIWTPDDKLKALPDRTLALAQSLLHSAFGVLQLLRCDPIVDIVEPDWIELLHVLRRDVDWDGNRVALRLPPFSVQSTVPTGAPSFKTSSKPTPLLPALTAVTVNYPNHLDPSLIEGVEENGLRRNLNIYIYDYCHKRGFKKTAHEPMQEANISPESNASTRTVKCALGAIQRQHRWQWVRGCYGVYIGSVVDHPGHFQTWAVQVSTKWHSKFWTTSISRRFASTTSKFQPLLPQALGKDVLPETESRNPVTEEVVSVREILNEEAQNVKDTNLQDLLPFRFAIHPRGMSREDCGLVEELFTDGSIQVLICTATFAWGINLPANTTTIKGTQIHNPEKGRWVELSSQDVLQILSCAGRLQYNTFSEACSTSIELPIESQFVSADNLNAEIVLGTIRNRDEAVQWIGYTYLYVRMLKSPSLYSVTNKMMFDEPVAKINVLLQAYISGLKLD
ncbi:hypothetical protein JOM56_015695, partial [Amanita muscaria]